MCSCIGAVAQFPVAIAPYCGCPSARVLVDGLVSRQIDFEILQQERGWDRAAVETELRRTFDEFSLTEVVGVIDRSRPMRNPKVSGLPPQSVFANGKVCMIYQAQDDFWVPPNAGVQLVKDMQRLLRCSDDTASTDTSLDSVAGDLEASESPCSHLHPNHQLRSFSDFHFQLAL